MKDYRRIAAAAGIYFIVVCFLFVAMVIAESKYGEPSLPFTCTGLAFLIAGFPASTLVFSASLSIAMLLAQSLAWGVVIDFIMRWERNKRTPNQKVEAISCRCRAKKSLT